MPESPNLTMKLRTIITRLSNITLTGTIPIGTLTLTANDAPSECFLCVSVSVPLQKSSSHLLRYLLGRSKHPLIEELQLIIIFVALESQP